MAVERAVVAWARVAWESLAWAGGGGDAGDEVMEAWAAGVVALGGVGAERAGTVAC